MNTVGPYGPSGGERVNEVPIFSTFYVFYEFDLMLSFSIVVHEYIKSIEGSPDLFEKLAKSDYKKNKDVSLLGSSNSLLRHSTE